MVPLYFSLVALSYLGFAGAEPFHVPLVRKSHTHTVDDYAIAADALRNKYGHTHSSASKRQNTGGFSVINQVCTYSSLRISV